MKATPGIEGRNLVVWCPNITTILHRPGNSAKVFSFGMVKYARDPNSKIA